MEPITGKPVGEVLLESACTNLIARTDAVHSQSRLSGDYGEHVQMVNRKHAPLREVVHVQKSETAIPSAKWSANSRLDSSKSRALAMDKPEVRLRVGDQERKPSAHRLPNDALGHDQ